MTFEPTAFDSLGESDSPGWVDREKAILAVYTRLWSEGAAMHGYVINLNGVVATGNLLFVGLLVTAAANSHGLEKPLLAVIPIVIAATGIFVTRVLWKDFLVLAAVIRKVDTAFGNFEVGRFLDADSLYPGQWLEYGQRRWSDAVFTIFPVFQGLLGAICATLIWLR